MLKLWARYIDMISVETISNKIQMLPTSSQKIVLDIVDDMLEKSAQSNQTLKASAWEDWAKSHTQNTVIIDDSREAIYEDE
jgi:hypothetical protein